MRWGMLVGGLASLAIVAQAPSTRPAPFDVVEATIAQMQRAMAEHRLTSRELVTQYLARIALYDKRINAAISINPRALEDADARDRERAAGRVRGPLHGIPIALKDNIHTTDHADDRRRARVRGFMPPFDATLTKNLRDAGAIIIAKTVLTELANWVAGAPTPMPGNYSAVGGFALQSVRSAARSARVDVDGRPALSTGGSSSGAGTAANFWAANVGTDTAGSVVNPAMLTMLVGLRPTTGRISRHGIIPITADQDTAGPMARTVTDAAILLRRAREPLARSGRRGDDALHAAAGTRLHEVPRRRRAARRAHRHSARVLLRADRPTVSRAAAAGARRTRRGRGGLGDAQTKLMAEAIDVLKRDGAIVVDPAESADRGRSRTRHRTSCRSTSARASTTRRARTTTARSC